MELGVANKIYMVAGGSKGLGLAIAKALVLDGAKVSIASRDDANVAKAKDQLVAIGGEESVLAAVCDVTQPEEISRWTEATIAQFGALDGLVVNAGGPPPGQFDNFDDEAWQQAFELTLLSAIRLIRSALPHLRQRGGGSILTLTSSSVKEPIDILLLSNVMRSGVASLAKSLSKQLAPEKIRVNNLVPGLIATDRMDQLDKTMAQVHGITPEAQRQAVSQGIPLGRYGDPDEFGKAGAFLLSEAASYITGATLVVDGGTMRAVN